MKVTKYNFETNKEYWEDEEIAIFENEEDFEENYDEAIAKGIQIFAYRFDTDEQANEFFKRMSFECNPIFEYLAEYIEPNNENPLRLKKTYIGYLLGIDSCQQVLFRVRDKNNNWYYLHDLRY